MCGIHRRTSLLFFRFPKPQLFRHFIFTSINTSLLGFKHQHKLLNFIVFIAFDLHPQHFPNSSNPSSLFGAGIALPRGHDIHGHILISAMTMFFFSFGGNLYLL
ncbi:hypothetical protein QVD17_25823 [Tagetes erecta]|uniref:Uncharacterized protein n=1 Tax=Tagetes erecta TaxID=13708 RepID=A0AAD8K5R1_TARER|nr:hypothetical protein QVD17_25823 [Tagetes erecta]